jgi:predicted secreted hydrolase
MAVAVTASAVCLLVATIAIAADDEWIAAGPDHDWSFPDDHHAMPEYRSEWWYLTGQVATAGEATPRFGLQLTIFRLGLTPELAAWQSDWNARDLVLGHLAVSDLASGRHVFSEVLTRAGPDRGGFPAPPDSVLAWVRAPAGTDGRWEIVRRGDGFAVRGRDARREVGLELSLTPERPPVLQGPGGFNVKDPTAGTGSLYYSFTRLRTTGRLALGGEVFEVAGRCWFDREVFTSQLASRHTGWDWLGLQLDDGRDLMAYALRDTSGRVDVTHATLVGPDGSVRWFDPDPGFMQPTDWWTSPQTGARYPVAWRLELPSADLSIQLTARGRAQENVGPRSGIVYWEGAVSGTTDRGVGCRGYVELTGYGGGPLPY